MTIIELLMSITISPGICKKEDFNGIKIFFYSILFLLIVNLMYFSSFDDDLKQINANAICKNQE